MDTGCRVNNMSQLWDSVPPDTVLDCWEKIYYEDLHQWASQFQEPQQDDGYNDDFHRYDNYTFQERKRKTKSVRSKKEDRSDFHRGKASKAKISSNRSTSHNHAERDWGEHMYWAVDDALEWSEHVFDVENQQEQTDDESWSTDDWTPSLPPMPCEDCMCMPCGCCGELNMDVRHYNSVFSKEGTYMCNG